MGVYFLEIISPFIYFKLRNYYYRYIYIYINIYTGSINDDRLAFQVFIYHVIIQMYIKLRHDLSILFLLLVL
jgi:hypothetical protein